MTITDDQGNKYELIEMDDGYYALEPIEQKPKRRRADKGNQYFYLDEMVRVVISNDLCWTHDQRRYDAHNYFQTKEEAEAARDKIKKLLTEEE